MSAPDPSVPLHSRTHIVTSWLPRSSGVDALIELEESGESVRHPRFE